MTLKMKKPDEEKLNQMYGQNEDRKKAYRKGWETVGKVLEENRRKKDERTLRK